MVFLMANGCATRVQRICKRLAGSCKGGGLAVEDIWSCQLQERGGGAFQRGSGDIFEELLFGYFGGRGGDPRAVREMS